MRPESLMHQVVSILLADDLEMFRRGLRSTLENMNSARLLFKVTETDNADAALDLLKENSFDLFIVSGKLAGENNASLLQQARRMRPKLRLLAVSFHDDPAAMKAIIKTGVDGYISKEVSCTQFQQATRLVLKGEKYYSPEVAIKLIEVEAEEARARNLKNKYGLTQREMEILQLIAQEETNEDIAKKLFISKRTVDTHRQNLLNKLKVKNTAGLVRAAIELHLVRTDRKPVLYIEPEVHDVPVLNNVVLPLNSQPSRITAGGL